MSIETDTIEMNEIHFKTLSSALTIAAKIKNLFIQLSVLFYMYPLTNTDNKRNKLTIFSQKHIEILCNNIKNTMNTKEYKEIINFNDHQQMDIETIITSPNTHKRTRSISEKVSNKKLKI
jgi:hypothetical protein